MNIIFNENDSFFESPEIKTPRVFNQNLLPSLKKKGKSESIKEKSSSREKIEASYANEIRELNKIIERIRKEKDLEIYARESENIELRKRLDVQTNSLLTPPKESKTRERKKTVVVNYTELRNEDDIKDLEVKPISYTELQEKLSTFTGRRIDNIDENYVLEVNCDSILGQQIVRFLVKFCDDKVQELRKLPPLKRIRIDNVGSMISDIRLMIKYCIPERLQIMNFNVNGSLIDFSFFIKRICENVVKRVNNLYLYYMSFKEDDIKRVCDAIKLNDHFQDLRLYACKIDISLFAEYLYENDTIWLVSLSFNHLKSSDAEDFIKLIKKLKRIREICAHHNNFEDEGCNKISQFIAENLLDQIDYVDLSNNQTKTDRYIKILEEKGFKGVVK